MPNILALIIKILPFLVQIAELIFNRPKAGAEKKAWIMNIVSSAMAGVDVSLTGGAAETWTQIKEPVGAIVDATATIMFPKADPNDPRYSNP